jgi:hypothetical protein
VNRLAVLDAVFAAGNVTNEDRSLALDGGNRSNDDGDALLLPDEPALWGVRLIALRTGLRG